MKKKIIKMKISDERFEKLCFTQSESLNSKEEEKVWFDECLKRDIWRPDISKLTVENFPDDISFRKFQQRLQFTSK